MITTIAVIDRDAMAVELQQTHLPVIFDISIHAVNFDRVVETVHVSLRILDVDNNVPMFRESHVALSLSEGAPSINKAN
jgi:3-deoxy-D-arabino-heptulosonate 7-phosphate (DAHP) synthase